MIDRDRELLETEIQRFPAEFGLRAFPGDRFRISRSASYVSGGIAMLYTERQVPLSFNRWVEFCKGTANELMAELVWLKGDKQ